MNNNYEVYRYYHLIDKHANLYLDKVLSPFGLCASYRTYIKNIIEHPGITRDEIKKLVHVHPSNTTRSLDYLEENAFIIKEEKEEDKRICILYPTQKLKEVYDVMMKEIDNWINQINPNVSEEELKKLNEVAKNAINVAHSK